MSDVLDLRPRLTARRRKECKHNCVTVDMTLAELTCDDCNAPLDPWWYIRRLAADDAEERDSTSRWIAEQHAKYETWAKDADSRMRNMNEQIQRRHEEITALYATKNRLMAEQVGGVRVGSVRRSPRRKAPAP